MENRDNTDREVVLNSTFLPGSGGHDIYTWHKTPETDPAAMLCLVHGLGEHSMRYAPMAEFMAERGIVVFGFDHTGHGRSGGKRGWASNSQLMLNDMESILMHARSLYPDLPLFLFGHSMGGNLVANYLIQDKSREISGAMISAAWLRLAMNVPPILSNIGIAIAKIWPGFRMGNQIDPALLSTDIIEVDAYRNDPLVHDKIAVGLFFDLVKEGKYAMEHNGNINVPLLVTHGTEDHITSYEASRQFAFNAGDGATFLPWEGCRHEPHNDIYRDKIYRKYTDWMLEQIDR